jgi:hypothetical protein
MKYLGRVLLVWVLAIGLVACGGTSEETPANDNLEVGSVTEEATGDEETQDVPEGEAVSSADRLEVPRGDLTVAVSNPGGRWETSEVETPGLGSSIDIVSSDRTQGYTLNLDLTNKFDQTLERNLRTILGEEPEVQEENGVRYVEGTDFTLYVDVNETFFATVTLTRTTLDGQSEIEAPYSDDWREMALSLEVIE